MKVTPQDLEALAKIAELDRSLLKIEHELETSLASTQQVELSRTLADSFDLAADRRVELENARDALKKLLIDVELVTKRLTLDEGRLNTLTNAKDVTGVQHEMQSLKERISLLEDQELEWMEKIERLEAELNQILSVQSDLKVKLDELVVSETQSLAKLNSERESVSRNRSEIVSALSEEVQSSYLRKATRGIGIGRLDGRECGACRLALTAASYEDVISTPADEVPSCPNCQALLLR